MDATWDDPAIVLLADRLVRSYHRRSGQPLLPIAGDAESLAHALYHAPLAVLAHDGAADPRFVYANRTAQRLWERDWRGFIGLPSRLSAEPVARDERQEQLVRAAASGFLTGYRGVRISASGRRFQLDDVTLWTVDDDAGQAIGQAAVFATWRFLDGA